MMSKRNTFAGFRRFKRPTHKSDVYPVVPTILQVSLSKGLHYGLILVHRAKIGVYLVNGKQSTLKCKVSG